MKTDKASRAIGQYSQGSRFGNIVFTSGQLPVNPISGAITVLIDIEAIAEAK